MELIKFLAKLDCMAESIGKHNKQSLGAMAKNKKAKPNSVVIRKPNKQKLRQGPSGRDRGGDRGWSWLCPRDQKR